LPLLLVFRAAFGVGFSGLEQSAFLRIFAV
jgi:hypothetical protein